MRILKTMLLVLTLTINASSQNNFAPIGAEWYYSLRENPFSSSAYGYYKLESIKDTTINGNYCKQIRKSYGLSNGEVHNDGFEILQVDTIHNKVYRQIDHQFYLLYDFTLSTNDTLKVTVDSGEILDTIKYVVDSIGTTLSIENTPLLTQFLRPVDFGWGFTSKTSVLIGNWNFLFPISDIQCDAGNCPMPLRCYSDQSINLRDEFFPCDTVFTINENKESAKIHIYPTFVKKEFTVTIDNNYSSDYSINIHSMSGKLLLSKQLESLQTTININNFLPGAYIVRIELNSYIFNRKIFKI